MTEHDTPTPKRTLQVVLEMKEPTKNKGKSTFWHTQNVVDLLKWSLSSVVLAAAALLISYWHKETELELKRIDSDANLIDAISSRFDTASLFQHKYLSHIKIFITSKELRAVVEQKIDSIWRDLKNTQHVAEETIKPRQEIAENELPEKVKAALKESARQNESVPISQQKPISDYKEIENNILEDATVARIDSLAVINIAQAKDLLLPQVKADWTKIGAPVTKWCKKGYYVEFFDALGIGVKDVNKTSEAATINLKKIFNDQITNIPFEGNESTVLSMGETIAIELAEIKYEISLDYIGAAGKNPFTKAAYLTVVRYKKQ